MGTSDPLCFVFVCQAGELEIKAGLLAASLQRSLGRAAELVAAVPVPSSRWGDLLPVTKALLDQLHVRMVEIENRIDDSYGHGNKVSALAAGANVGRTIFLDSDILCLRAPDQEAFSASFCAKPADLGTWGEVEGQWEEVYRLFGLALPSRRVVTTVSGQLSPPYFNAGVIAVEDAPAFARCWEEACIRVDRADNIPRKRPWLDQIALPVAVERLGLDFRVLSDSYNFPAHLRPLPNASPVFCHYHSPEVLRREPVLTALVRQLAADHPPLAGLVRRGGDEWRRVLAAPRRLSPPKRPMPWRHWLNGRERRSEMPGRQPEVLITGIPRSGTSLLCRLLHEQPDCVVVNEPAEIFGPLTNCENPWWIACYYRELRRDILEGEAIENKVEDGRIVEDTRKLDRRARYHPRVSRSDFLLGTKNTLLYLARIPVIRRALPEAPIIACVRHPLDTLASWKDSFAHLRDVKLDVFPVSYADNAFLSGLDRRRLRHIVETEDPSQRRALLWAHLAETIETHRESLVIVKYEDLVADPVTEMRRILGAVPGFDVSALRPPALTLRTRRELLDEADMRAAADLCGREAAYFGYDLP
jgi:hypothetical protein